MIFGDGEWGGWSIRDRKCGSYRVFMSDEFWGGLRFLDFFEYFVGWGISERLIVFVYVYFFVCLFFFVFLIFLFWNVWNVCNVCVIK